MKKILLLFFLIPFAFTVEAALTNKKIYIDPGHGSYGPNDRPMATISYPMLSSTGRPEIGVGFYESNTNLWKCEELSKKLKAAGAVTLLSHTECGGTTDGTKYNPSLSARRTEATNWGADYFISIHSNAATEGTETNYLYFALSGHSGVSTSLQTLQRQTAETSWPYAFEFMGEGLNGYAYEPHTHYTYTNMKIAPQSLGVMRHSIRGFLTEGYFHTYQPSRHRGLNKDWCRQEGVRYYRGIAAYYSHAAETKGYIMGVVKRSDKLMTRSATLKAGQFYYKTGSHDQFYPCNGATVYLYNAAKTETLKTYTVDQNWNGVFVFEDLAPGTYYLGVNASGCGNVADTYRRVVVSANKTTYPIVLMTAGTFDPAKEPINNGGSSTPEPVEQIKAIYAYGLKLTTNTDSYTFAFTANSHPSSASLVFYKNGTEVGRKAIASPQEGANSVTFKKTDIPGTVGDVLTWGVELNGKSITDWAQLYSETGYTYTRAFNTVDNSPESNYFGRIYVIDRVGADNVKNGVHAYNPTWERITNPTPPYQPSSDDQWRNPARPTVAPDGSLFVSDWGDAHAGIWVAGPGAVSGTYTQFFAGTKGSDGVYTNGTTVTGSCVVTSHICGTGADMKLIVYNEDKAGTLPANGIAIYNIGKADGTFTAPWTTAPSKVIALPDESLTEPPGNVWGTSHGIFVSLNRESITANTADAPSLRFYDYDGTLQYTSAGVADIQGSKGGGYAVSRDEKTLIINDAAGNFVVFNITWNGNKPSLTKKTTYNHGLTTHIRQMNFDYAGNLLVSGEGGFYIFSVPTTTNKTTTPAKKSLTVLGGGGSSTTNPEPTDTATLVNGTITFSQLWSKTQAESGYLLTGNENRSFAYYNGSLYIPNKSAATFSVVNATTGTLTTTKSLGTSSFLLHNLRITEDGKMLLGNTNAGTIGTAAITVLGSDISAGGQTTLGSGVLGGRGDFFYTYGKWNADGYLIAISNDVTPVAGDDSVAAIVKIPFSKGVLGTSTRVTNAALPVVGYSAKAIPSIDGKTFYVSAVGITPTQHDIITGDFVDGFGEEKPVQLPNANTSGLAVFTIHGHTYMITPLSRFGQFEIYDISIGLSHATKVTEVGTTAALGNTANAAVSVDFATHVDGNDVYIYELVPNNGIAAYKFTFTPDEVVTPEPTNPDVTYGSVKFYYQEGTLDVPADNAALWELFKPAVNSYYSLNRADQPIDAAAVFLTLNKDNPDLSIATMLTDPSSPWKWLGDYIASISLAKGIELTSEAQWRYTVSQFFNCAAARTSWPAAVSFEAEGKPAAWQPYYIFKHQPSRSGYTFLGWYDNPNGTGSALTSLPASGNVYACWKSNISTPVEAVENTSAIYLVPTITGVDVFFEGTKRVTIYNINGMQLTDALVSEYFAFDLQSGMYIIRVGDETFKFIR